MDTQYEVFITPFYKSILGLPSASRLAKTRHALPSRAPVLANLTLTSDSLAVNWRSLDDVFTNGVLQGYDVRVNVSGGGGGVVINVNPADTEAVIKLADLIINGDSSIADEDLVGDSGVSEVSVEVAAVNKAGTGPFSPPQVRSVDFSLVNRGEVVLMVVPTCTSSKTKQMTALALSPPWYSAFSSLLPSSWGLSYFSASDFRATGFSWRKWTLAAAEEEDETRGPPTTRLKTRACGLISAAGGTAITAAATDQMPLNGIFWAEAAVG